MAAVAHAHDLLLIDDLGSGAAEPIADEPTVAESLQHSDVVTFSGDKLFGGPQAGIVLGRGEAGAAAVKKMSRHPLARAVRIDKLTLAALEATLRQRLAGRLEEIPVERMLRASADDVRRRAAMWSVKLEERGVPVTLVSGRVRDRRRLGARLRPAHGAPVDLRAGLAAGGCVETWRAAGDRPHREGRVLPRPADRIEGRGRNAHRRGGGGVQGRRAMSFVIGTAGHIDHGKSTLITALTGIDPDRLAEEKRRGMTIDLGFAHLRLPSGLEIGIVDVPGHARFIRNMLAGTHGLDAVMLVIAADEGVMPQTREHLEIIDLLEVRRGVVVLTKVDLVDAEWLSLVTSEVRATLKGTSLEGAAVIPFSAAERRGESRSFIGGAGRAARRAPTRGRISTGRACPSTASSR